MSEYMNPYHLIKKERDEWKVRAEQALKYASVQTQRVRRFRESLVRAKERIQQLEEALRHYAESHGG